MKAKERAFLTVDSMRRDILFGLTGNAIKELIENLTRAILDDRHEIIEDCATYVEKWPYKSHWWEDVVVAIHALEEEQDGQ